MDTLANGDVGTTERGDVEYRAKDALNKAIGTLENNANKLYIAGDHFQHSYQGDSKPGIGSVMDASIKNTAAVLRRQSGQSEEIAHVVTVADQLDDRVQKQLNVIEKGGGPEKGVKQEVGENSDKALLEFEKLSTSKNEQEFNKAVEAIRDSLTDSITKILQGVTLGQKAASLIFKISENAEATFLAWWKQNYKDDYAMTMVDFQKSLQILREASLDRQRIYEQDTNPIKAVANDVEISPFLKLISEYRQIRFPQAKS